MRRIIRVRRAEALPSLSRGQRWMIGGASALLFALAYAPFIAPPVEPTVAADVAAERMPQLWRDTDVERADLLNGPWGRALAPDPHATYMFAERKTNGVNPGMSVRDPAGRPWSVKQGAEGPIEPTLSRVLSALGYHQPPVYYLPAFTLDRDGRVGQAQGGRSRLKLPDLMEAGTWSWQQNPFVGTRPYQGLLVVLMLFNSSDLKNANNNMYEMAKPREDATRWFVVKDLGAALGETARLNARRGNPDLFEKSGFIAGVRDGYVEFDYHGWHQELVRRRITPADVKWACERLARLSDRQWRDAFAAGGYAPAAAERFIRAINTRINEGLRITGA